MRNLFHVAINPGIGGEHYHHDIRKHVISQPSITCPQAGVDEFAITVHTSFTKKKINKIK